MMGKLICLVGKSGSGKDTLFKNIIEDNTFQITPIIPCTTRPKRKIEIDGVDYQFVSYEDLLRLEQSDEIIEKRVYHTVKGDWYYFTKSFCLAENESLTIIITTPAAIKELSKRFGKNNIIIVYLEADDYTRIERCLQRERTEKRPNYQEVCRRYLADEQDFAFFANEDFSLYYSSFKINANKSIMDCKKQFASIYKTIGRQIKVSKNLFVKPDDSNKPQCSKLCHEYIANACSDYPDFSRILR